MSTDLAAERLLAEARRTPDPVAAARLIAEAFFAASRTADPARLAPLVDALAALRGGHPEPGIEILFHTVAGVVGVRTRQRHATRHLEAVLRIFAAQQPSTDELHLECAVMSTLTLIRPHEARPRFAHLVDRLELEPARRARIISMIGLGDSWAGDLVRGRAGLREAHRSAREAGHLDIQAEAASWLIKVEALCGDLDASAARLVETRELAARTGSGWIAPHIAECASVLHLVRGDTEAWAGVLAFLVETVVGANSGLIFEHRWELATHHALRGAHDRAAALLDGVPDPPLEWPGAPALPAWRGWIVAPEDQSAMARFEASLQGLNRPVERLSRARMSWLLGAQHGRLGNRGEATRLLEAACTGYAAAGAAGPHALVMADLQQVTMAGGATGDGLPVRDGARLTAAEIRVARAAAGGLSNREVADRLGLSAKTVEFHLGNVFRKLGVRNRTELATRRVELR